MTVHDSKVVQQPEGCKCISRKDRLVAAVDIFGELLHQADQLSARIGAIPADGVEKVEAKVAAMDLHELISGTFWQAARELAVLEGRPVLQPIETRVSQVCQCGEEPTEMAGTLGTRCMDKGYLTPRKCNSCDTGDGYNISDDGPIPCPKCNASEDE